VASTMTSSRLPSRASRCPAARGETHCASSASSTSRRAASTATKSSKHSLCSPPPRPPRAATRQQLDRSQPTLRRSRASWAAAAASSSRLTQLLDPRRSSRMAKRAPFRRLCCRQPSQPEQDLQAAAVAAAARSARRQERRQERLTRTNPPARSNARHLHLPATKTLSSSSHCLRWRSSLCHDLRRECVSAVMRDPFFCVHTGSVCSLEGLCSCIRYCPHTVTHH
jgi:hypothetical protein